MLASPTRVRFAFVRFDNLSVKNDSPKIRIVCTTVKVVSILLHLPLSISLNCDESMKSDWFNHFYNLNLPTRSFKFSAISAKLLELFLISSIELAACSIVAEVS